MCNKSHPAVNTEAPIVQHPVGHGELDYSGIVKYSLEKANFGFQKAVTSLNSSGSADTFHLRSSLERRVEITGRESAEVPDRCTNFTGSRRIKLLYRVPSSTFQTSKSEPQSAADVPLGRRNRVSCVLSISPLLWVCCTVASLIERVTNQNWWLCFFAMYFLFVHH